MNRIEDIQTNEQVNHNTSEWSFRCSGQNPGVFSASTRFFTPEEHARVRERPGLIARLGPLRSELYRESESTRNQFDPLQVNRMCCVVL